MSKAPRYWTKAKKILSKKDKVMIICCDKYGYTLNISNQYVLARYSDYGAQISEDSDIMPVYSKEQVKNDYGGGRDTHAIEQVIVLFQFIDWGGTMTEIVV